MKPEDFHFPHSIITSLAQLVKGWLQTPRGMLTVERTHPPMAERTLRSHHLIGHFYCNEHGSPRKRDTLRQQPPLPDAERMIEMALTVDEKKSFLRLSETSKFPAAPPPPRDEAAPPPHGGLSIHWFSIFPRPPSRRLPGARLAGHHRTVPRGEQETCDSANCNF